MPEPHTALMTAARPLRFVRTALCGFVCFIQRADAALKMTADFVGRR